MKIIPPGTLCWVTNTPSFLGLNGLVVQAKAGPEPCPGCGADRYWVEADYFMLNLHRRQLTPFSDPDVPVTVPTKNKIDVPA